MKLASALPPSPHGYAHLEARLAHRPEPRVAHLPLLAAPKSKMHLKPLPALSRLSAPLKDKARLAPSAPCPDQGHIRRMTRIKSPMDLWIIEKCDPCEACF